jgi:signal transduction histidine kinase
MKLSRLKWMALAGVAAYVLLLDSIRTQLLPFLASPGARLLLNAVAALGAVFLLGLAFHFVERIHRRSEKRSAELLALHHAALDISGDLDLEVILQKVVDRARVLIGARYGALAVYESGGRIESFLTSGIDADHRRRIGDPPVGKGLLGVVLHEGESLRLPELGRDARSVGFPAHHPPMRSLLAVPIVCQSPFRGNLYLADKREEPEFDAEDEAALTRFATQAALAIDASHLHEQLRGLAIAEERLRLAHEMHDGLAQVLASVNAGTQAVREYLRSGRVAEATTQLDRLAAASRDVYAEVREGILALRSAGASARSDRPVHEILVEYVTQWQDQTGIDARIDVRDGVALTAASELQLLRIAQESLANVRKHSGARKVSLELRQEEESILLRVADDGRGFDPGAAPAGGMPRFGLATMRERAQSIGGRLEIESVPDRGTTVTLRLPARRAEAR